MATVLITDLDNTLYDFIDYFGPCFRAMRSAVARVLGASKATLTEDFKRVYAEHGSVEFPYVIENLALVRQLTDDERKRVVHIGSLAFSQQSRSTLKPYPGVVETLDWAMQNKIVVVALTNAPMRYALHRLRQLGLSRFIYGIAAFEGHETEDVVPDDEEKVDLYKLRSAIKRRWLLGSDELKPEEAGLKRVVRSLELDRAQFYLVGDNVANDLVPAARLGGIGVLARYGKKFAPENMDTLMSVTPWSDAKVRKTYATMDYVPPYEIDNFLELKSILPSNQPSLL